MKEPVRPGEVVRFGVFEADIRTRELRKNGLKIRLQEQPFQVLSLLLERPGELVTREELHRKLWPADTFVDFEHGLNKAINKLRTALGDNRGTPRYVETLPRRGYRFIAPVARPAAMPDARESAAPETTIPRASDTGRPRPKIGPTARAMIILFAVLAPLASVSWYKLAPRPVYPAAGAVSAALTRSLAVLPLQNLSGNDDQEYFADGITDELITELGQMSALRVISRTSVMHYKRTAKTVPEIGRELGADTIVEGTVFRFGDRVRITAQLVDARTDRHLWARKYERDLRDVISLQDEVARDIALQIRVKLTSDETVRLANAHPVNPEAHEAYLKGRYYWNQFTEDGVKKSRAFFEQAIAKDPHYALGYSGLADYYAVMYVRFGRYSTGEACPKAEAAALRALELDESLAEAHNSLAAIRFICDWDWQAAETESRRAIQLNPNHAESRRIYADLLAYLGRSEEAVAQIKRAVENDPMSPDLNWALGFIYYLTRDNERALAQFRKALAMGSDGVLAHWGLGNVYTQTRQLRPAAEEYRKMVELFGGQPGESPELAYAYALAGKRHEALEILKHLNQMAAQQPLHAFERALICAGLDDKQQALNLLEKAYDAHDSNMLRLKVDPQYASLHSDPRFQALLRRMNFPP